jgi:REP element-mobilizing transposase RayT
MNSKEIAPPTAYFITFTTYGTWLHGKKTMSVDRQHNTLGTDFLTGNVMREKIAAKNMTETQYLLNKPQREIVLNTIHEVCRYRGWGLLAAHVRTNHAHLVIHANAPAEKILCQIKAYASRRLKDAEVDGHRLNRWTRHGSTKYLWNEEQVEATIHYVVYEQGNPMAVFENKSRSHYAGQIIIW